MLKKTLVVALLAGTMLGLTACGGELATNQATGETGRSFDEQWVNVSRGEVLCNVIMMKDAFRTSDCDWSTLRPKTGKAKETAKEELVKTSRGTALCIVSRDSGAFVITDCDWSTLTKN